MDTTLAVDGALTLVLSFFQHDQALFLDALVSYRVRQLRNVAEGHGSLRHKVLIVGGVVQFGHIVGHDATLRYWGIAPGQRDCTRNAASGSQAKAAIGKVTALKAKK